MKLKGINTEDFVNYKKPSMFLITSYCDFKCCKDNTIKSLHEVEYFLNHFHRFIKYIKLYKMLK